MDGRWEPSSVNSFRNVQVLLHPTASLYEIRTGFEGTSNDSVDLSQYLTAGTQTQFELNVTLNFRRQLFGTGQPKPNQILEVKLWQKGKFQTLWLGVIDAITSFTMSKGERSMQLIARSRDSHDVFRVTKRVTPFFPQLTDFVYIVRRIAESAGLKQDEILLPISAFQTRHSNTQLADMSAWDMITSVFMALGWTPFIDGLGRLRAANRELQGRRSDVTMLDDRIIRIGASRQRSPVTRIRVKWLDPVLRKNVQDARKLTDFDMTMGWFIPYWKHTVYFSEDKSQRATDTYMDVARDSSGHKYGVNSLETFGIPIHFVDESYEQKADNYGVATFNNIFGFSATILDLIAIWILDNYLTDGAAGEAPVAAIGGGVAVIAPPAVQTVPMWKSTAQAVAQGFWFFMLMAIGSGKYEIWGKPFDWIHPRNITDAFDISAPVWSDNPVDIDNDFIINEGHAKAVAVRELIFQARSANKWSVSVTDHPGIEMGDIVEFTDGTRMYIEDFSRQLGKGSEATVELRGFIVGAGVLSMTSQTVIAGMTGDAGEVSDPGGPPIPPSGGGSGGTPGDESGARGTSKLHPKVTSTLDPAGLMACIMASWTGIYHTAMPQERQDYWYGKASNAEKFSNQVWYIGWNRYWEERMRSSAGSSNPDYGDQPALFQP